MYAAPLRELAPFFLSRLKISTHPAAERTVFPVMIKSYAVIKLIKALPISKRITSPLHVDAAEMLEVQL